MAKALPEWGRALGFSQIGVADADLSSAEPGLLAWLSAGCHGTMDYMARHGVRRARPAEVFKGTLRVITARMDYLPRGTPEGWQAAELARSLRPGEAVVSVYARGRDYHKVLRNRMQSLAERIEAEIGPFGHRAFTDTGPVMEVELATRAGLGWRGKHTLALSREGGSMSFLGELLVTLPLPLTEPDTDHCGQCSACLDACPTQAFQGPCRLDARRCISYLTIEHEGAIDEALRPLIGNHLYGCDDCQLVCPWNKFAQPAVLADFDVREPWGAPDLLDLWRWDEPTFVQRNLGSAIRAIGWQRWRRNLAVVSGNAIAAGAPNAALLRQALAEALPQADDLVAEHIAWALARG